MCKDPIVVSADVQSRALLMFSKLLRLFLLWSLFLFMFSKLSFFFSLEAQRSQCCVCGTSNLSSLFLSLQVSYMSVFRNC
mmetsp:Transcript_4504/g.7863  ORF Transcript_4504/g.7863 Transcript_4504/m.7863 type:complete len:80 (+) Transcript_4504:97-336(+)